MIDSLIGVVLLMLLAGWMGAVITVQSVMRRSADTLSPSEKIAYLRAVALIVSKADSESEAYGSQFWDWKEWRQRFPLASAIDCANDNSTSGFLSPRQVRNDDVRLPALRELQRLLVSPLAMQRLGDGKDGDEAFNALLESDLAPFQEEIDRNNMFRQNSNDVGSFRLLTASEKQKSPAHDWIIKLTDNPWSESSLSSDLGLNLCE